MADQVYVDFDAADDLGNGSTGSPYKFVQTALDNATLDLTTTGLEIRCRNTSGGDSNEQIIFPAFTNATSSNFVKLMPDTGYEPSGTGPVLRIYYNAGFNGIAFDMSDIDYTQIHGMKIENTYTGGGYTATVEATNVHTCIIQDSWFIGKSDVLKADAATNNDLTLRNSVFDGVGNSGGVRLPSGPNSTVEHCVFHDMATGLIGVGLGTNTLYNNAFLDCTNVTTGSPTWAGSNNAHESGASGVPSGPTGWVTTLDATDFENAASDDFRAASGGDLEDAGTDRTSTVPNDMFGTARATTPEIGYFELAAGGGGIIIQAMHHYTKNIG